MEKMSVTGSAADEPRAPLVSVVVLNWNSGKRIYKCLEHVFNQTYPALEVIIVDNGSTDGSINAVMDRWGGKVKIVRNAENLGFAKGMNQGIEVSRGEYVLLLNDDLYLDTSYIARAVSTMEQASGMRIGMLSGIIFKYRDGEYTDEVDSVGVYLLPYHTIINSKNSTVPEYVFGSAGAALFLLRDMLDDIRLQNGDYLDSSYFAYGEDIELCFRAQLLGWKCLFVSIVVGWHVGSASTGEERMVNKDDHLQVHAIKNRFFTILTCYPLCLWVWTLFWNALADLGVVGFSIGTGRWRLLRNWFRAVIITVQMLPKLLRKRRWLQSRSLVSCEYLRSLYVKQSGWDTLRSLIQRL